MTRLRLDQLLVQKGLAADRRQAEAWILRGLVQVEGRRVDKAGTPTDEGAEIQVAAPPRYVSRGGLKLEAALAGSGLDPSGLVCLDLGASTGGFTDCLLQHGARRVYAFDVGHGQLDWNLRQDPRVVVRERVNVRRLTPDEIPDLPRLVTIDLSFISLRLVLPRLEQFGPLDVLALVKPQFEARREEVEAGGVIRDEATRLRIVARVRRFAVREGFQVRGQVPSPVAGAKGNREEFLVLAWPGRAD